MVLRICEAFVVGIFAFAPLLLSIVGVTRRETPLSVTGGSREKETSSQRRRHNVAVQRVYVHGRPEADRTDGFRRPGSDGRTDLSRSTCFSLSMLCYYSLLCSSVSAPPSLTRTFLETHITKKNLARGERKKQEIF